MSPDPYSPRVRSLFAAPAHAGTLPGMPAVLVDDQGVRIALAARCRQGRIEALRFLAWGCPHVIAAAEAFCASYEGRPVRELDAFAAAELMQSLPVPAEKTGRILVIEDAVRSLGNALRPASGSKTDD
jgi:NifU-like protein involved in Fe-S cluster formation